MAKPQFFGQAFQTLPLASSGCRAMVTTVRFILLVMVVLALPAALTRS
jgi:hypothetical protein